MIKRRDETTGMIIEESRDQGCIPVLNELFEKYIDLPYYVLPVLASLQLIGIITGVILLIFLAQNEDLAQADSELDSEFDDDDRDAPMELPKPKLFCIIKQVRDPRTTWNGAAVNKPGNRSVKIEIPDGPRISEKGQG